MLPGAIQSHRLIANQMMVPGSILQQSHQSSLLGANIPMTLYTTNGAAQGPVVPPTPPQQAGGAGTGKKKKSGKKKGGEKKKGSQGGVSTVDLTSVADNEETEGGDNASDKSSLYEEDLE